MYDIEDIDKPPKDKFYFTYIVTLFLGCSAFLLWKTFITPYDYFDQLYPMSHFELWFAMFYWYPAIPGMILMTAKGDKIPLNIRIYTSLLVYGTIMAITPFFPHFFKQTSSLFVTMGSVLIGGAFSAVLFASAFGMAAALPPLYTQGVMTGNAVAGITTFTFRVLTKAFIADDLYRNTLFFWTSAATVIFTAVLYFFSQRSKFVQYYIKNKNSRHSVVNETAYDSVPLLEQTGNRKCVTWSNVFSRIWPHVAQVVLTFTTTAALWPGIVTEIDPSDVSLTGNWFKIVVIGIFCTGDLIGRYLSRWGQKIFTPRTLWIPVVLRLAFFPLLILQAKPVLIDSKWAVCTCAFLLPTTGGYFGGLGMIYGSQRAKVHEKEKAGTMMAFSLNGGIFLGTNIAILLLYLTTGSIWNTN